MVMGYGAVINGGEELINVGIPYVAKQVRLIRGAPEKVQSLEDELQFIVEALGEYDHVFMKDSTVKEWLNQIQKLASSYLHTSQQIKTKMEEIDGYQKKYFPDLFVPTNSEWLEKQRREVEEEDVVGFDVAIQEVRNMLLTKTLKRQGRVVGHPWEGDVKIDDEKLVEKARSLLQGKRYLVVIDGVEETQLWETLEKDKVFPKEKHQSRLLLTTRSQNVASLASSSTDDQSNIHVMEPLDDDRSWEPGKAGIQRWKLLFTTEEYWKTSCFQVCWAAACYFINLWMAEELIEETGRSRAEEIGWRYLHELRKLNLIQFQVHTKLGSPLSSNVSGRLSIHYSLSQDMEKIQRCLECLDRLDCLQKLKIINPAILPSRPGTLPAQLVKVTLLETDLVADDVMRMLENLDHLQVLKLLKKSIRGPDLEMRPNSFPQLRFLFMEEIGVRTWTICDGAMRSLEELTISRCHELELLPEQIRELPNILQIKVDSRSYCLKQKRQQLSQ
ncbi:hypothetical protein F3Y22_tig00110202pilonHSYRG00117 [Hibiscus syriacus]|uniref:NB-ARC domain-containing protein n=1 Tax=Hibiscus syriacus TaxID=106335 RepID=A0A6A3BAB9_HIBSY|nr:hypothetical protein F3Y22_tig00110202pilonHSYRG00117 [Hibiscus syriacus]